MTSTQVYNNAALITAVERFKSPDHPNVKTNEFCRRLISLLKSVHCTTDQDPSLGSTFILIYITFLDAIP
jgi:hypothetical protein